MTIEELLRGVRIIWGDKRFNLEEIVVRQGVAVGDVHRAMPEIK